jgi:hypothetical protein
MTHDDSKLIIQTPHKEITLGINFDLKGIECNESIEMKEIEYQANLSKK